MNQFGVIKKCLNTYAMCVCVCVCVCSLCYPACNAYAPCYTVICGLSGCIPHFSTLSHKLHDFRKKCYLNTKCEFWFSRQLPSETFLVLRWILRDVTKGCIDLHVKCPLFLSDFSETRTLSTDFRNILKYQISRESVQWEPRSSMRTHTHTHTHTHTRGQTDRQIGRHDEANSRFSYFYERA